MKETYHRRLLFLWLPALLLFLTVVYFPVLQNSYTNWDEEKEILRNPLILEFSRESLRAAFTDYHWNQYVPIPLLAFMLEHHFLGFEPFFTHLIDLLLHLANVFLLFIFAHRLTKNARLAFLVSLLFGLHPMQVESVAWVRERQNLIYTFFFLGSLIAYVRFAARREWPAYLICFLLMMLSCMSKALAITLPCVFILCDLYRGVRSWPATVLEKVPFFLLSFLTTAVAVRGVEFSSQGASSVGERLCLGSYSIILFLEKLLVPVNLSALYPYPEKVAGAYPSMVLASPVIFGFLLIGTVFLGLRFREVTFGALFFLGNIAPVSRFFPVGASLIISDHFVYVPIIGFLMAIAGPAIKLYKNKKNTIKRGAILCVFIMIGLLAIQTRERIKIWESSVTVFEEALVRAPQSMIPYNQLGLHYLVLQEWDKALHYYTMQVNRFPESGRARLIRAKAYIRKGDFSRALADLETAGTISGKSPEVLFHRGIVNLLQHRYPAAVADFSETVNLQPELSAAYLNRAWARFFLGDLKAAWEDCSAALHRRDEKHGALLIRTLIELVRGNFSAGLTDLHLARNSLGIRFPELLQKETGNFLSFFDWDFKRIVFLILPF